MNTTLPEGEREAWIQRVRSLYDNYDCAKFVYKGAIEINKKRPGWKTPEQVSAAKQKMESEWADFWAHVTNPPTLSAVPPAAVGEVVKGVKYDNDACVKAAEAVADNYRDDPRQDITTDVTNAFYAGVRWLNKLAASQPGGGTKG